LVEAGFESRLGKRSHSKSPISRTLVAHTVTKARASKLGANPRPAWRENGLALVLVNKDECYGCGTAVRSTALC